MEDGPRPPAEWAPGTDPGLREAWACVAGQMDLRPCNGCDLCKIRCAEGVQMNREEYLRVRSLETEMSGLERSRLLSQDKRVDLGDGVEVRMCRYLDMEGGGCAVYAARPLVCRLLGHVEWLPCPVDKIERPVPTADALALMRAYSQEERLTFDEWDARLERAAGTIPDPEGRT